MTRNHSNLGTYVTELCLHLRKCKKCTGTNPRLDRFTFRCGSFNWGSSWCTFHLMERN